MNYKLLADAVFVFHMVWIVILLGGIGVQFRYEWDRPIHMAVVTITIVSQLIFLGCPLVALEQALRRKYDASNSFTGSFVVYYLRFFGVEVSPTMVTGILAVIATTSFVIWVLPELHRGVSVF